VDQALGAVPARDVVGVCRGLAAGLLDLVHQLLRRARGRAGAVARAAEVVDDDLRAALGEQQRVLAADAPARTGDRDDASFHSGHARLLGCGDSGA
jgi:hypothetical protein